ncbi:sugar phosphate isomerase/epimerase family protein [Novipirellula artificiosorum]|uniref:D-tagatose 3-epimerase n=1 Tax=Novipirellula artificiosorum TaxID=2528016 RepID=A0A5C6D9W2_9BACT|nr:sugar phosphate isomerase/epimerase family protein [Novipirellula artificiosorum]TWU33712.1 D-tagatose 3-epimerase [Novipirellula artificiosorum]
MPRRYAICNETFQDWTLDRATAYAKAAGYTGWEVAPFMLASGPRQFSKSQRDDYRDTVVSAGLELVGLHWLLAKTEGFHLTTLDENVRRRTSDYFAELAEWCSDLGGDVMVLGSPGQRNLTEGQSMDQAMQNAAEVLAAVVPVLHQYGVRIALEPLGPAEGNFLNTAAEARRLQSMIASPLIGLHLDVKAMSTEQVPIDQVIRDNADWMIHFHANDPNLLGPGMGDVEFGPIFAALDQVGYEGWVSVEVFDYAPGVERLVTESMQNMIAAQTT